MALQKQTVSVPFVAGVDKKTDAKLSAKPSQLDNGQFVDANTISRRPGRTLKSFTGPNAGAGGTKSLHDFNGRLQAVGPASLKHGSLDGNLSVTASATTTPTVEAFYRDAIDVCLSTDGALVASAEVAGSRIYQASDMALVWDDGNASNPFRVIQDATHFYFIGRLGVATTLQVAKVSKTTFARTTYNTTLSLNTTGGLGMDACVLASGQLLLGYIAATTSFASAVTVDMSGAGSTVATYATATAAAHVAVAQFSSTKVMLAYANAARTDVTYISLTAALGSAATTTQAALTDVRNLALTPSGADVVAYFDAGTGNARAVFSGTITDTPTGSAATQSQRGSWVMAVPAFIGTAPWTLFGYEMVNTTSVDRFSTYVMRNGTGSVGYKGTIFNGLARRATATTTFAVPQLSYSATAKKAVALVDLGLDASFTPSGGAFQVQGPRVIVKLDFDAKPVSAFTQDEFVLSGSQPRRFLGSIGGIPFYPVGITAVAASTGSLEAGVHQVVAVYEYITSTDKKVFRSAATVPISVTVTAGQKITFTCPTLRADFVDTTQASNNLLVTRIAIYCTAANQQIFYRIGGYANSTGADTVSDDILQVFNSSEVLYTQSGELDDEPPPPTHTVCAHQNRIFAVNEFRDTLRFSKPAGGAYGLSFPADFEIPIPNAKGKVVAVASMDDKLFVFCQRGIYFITGEGPNDLGQGSTYSPPQLIVDGTGAIDGSAHVLAVCEAGIAFQTNQGLRMLSRGLGLIRAESGMYWGAEVDSDISRTVPLAAALFYGAKNQLRFYDGTNAYVYDTHFNQWSRFTNQPFVDAVLTAEQLALAASSGDVFEEGGSTDAGTAVALTVVTPWMKLAGVQGFQRIYKALLLGTYRSASTLSIQVGYDYADAYETAQTFDTSAFSTSVPIELRYDLPKQKCAAVRFKISESGGSGDGFSLTDLSLEFGINPGLARMPASRRL